MEVNAYPFEFIVSMFKKHFSLLGRSRILKGHEHFGFAWSYRRKTVEDVSMKPSFLVLEPKSSTCLGQNGGAETAVYKTCQSFAEFFCLETFVV